jgi:hypothetical protein
MDAVTSNSVSSDLEALIEEFFASVSFGEGERPAYENLRDLFIAEGKLINTGPQPPEVASVDDFIQPRRRMVDTGELTSFREVELAAHTQVFGNVAQRISTYKKRGARNAALFSARGVISTQFVKTPAGWRISSMAWDDERPGLEVPELSATASASAPRDST